MIIKTYNNEFKKENIKNIKKTTMNFELDLNKVNKRITKITKELQKFKKFKNYIIIGNGGSINPFFALYHALKDQLDKNKRVFILNTEDILKIKEIQENTNIKDTLVIIISKSGETSTIIVDYFKFTNYKKIILTSNRESTIAKIALQNKDFIIDLPKEISGRYSGFTETALIPLYLLGCDIQKIIDGAKQAKKYKKKAKKLAEYLYKCEINRYYDLFVPIYSYRLSKFFILISQLFHESFGKSNKGLTVFGGLAPETQHHTNQRFFGGRDNASALFIYYEESENKEKRNKSNKKEVIVNNIIKIPQKFKKIKKLDKLNNKTYNEALYFEYIGTRNNAIKKNKHIITIEFKNNKKNIYQEVTKLLMILYYLAVYSSLYRNVNPYNQPAVEDSKRITMDLLLK